MFDSGDKIGMSTREKRGSIKLNLHCDVNTLKKVSLRIEKRLCSKKAKIGMSSKFELELELELDGFEFKLEFELELKLKVKLLNAFEIVFELFCLLTFEFSGGFVLLLLFELKLKFRKEKDPLVD